MDFRNFFISYVFDVKESVFRSFTRRFCSGDLENPGQLPVLQELEGTDGWVLWIFVISSFPSFTKSRNLFLVVLWRIWGPEEKGPGPTDTTSKLTDCARVAFS